MRPLPSADAQLVQIVDAALAESAQRSGEWLACRPGCTQCCIGVFAINSLDALRLQHGLRQLEGIDPQRAARIRERAHESARRLAPDYPGDAVTGMLFRDPESQARFEDFGNEEPCPALDPSTGLCDLYASRPLTCRTFGPPVRTEGGLGVCELCFEGASEQEIAACEMKVDPEGLEPRILKLIGDDPRQPAETIVTFALLGLPNGVDKK